MSSFVSILLHRGANPLITDSNGQTPLHHAVKRNFITVCQKLLDNNAMAMTKDMQGCTPYRIAIEAHNDDIAALLLVYTPNLVYAYVNIILLGLFLNNIMIAIGQHDK